MCKVSGNNYCIMSTLLEQQHLVPFSLSHLRVKRNMNNFVAFSWASSKLSLKRHAKKIQKYNLCVLMKHSVGCIPSCIWRSIFGRQEKITVLETLADMLFDSAYGEHVIPKFQKKKCKCYSIKVLLSSGEKKFRRLQLQKTWHHSFLVLKFIHWKHFFKVSLIPQLTTLVCVVSFDIRLLSCLGK